MDECGGARLREQKLLDRCAAVAMGMADTACDEQEANLFRSAAVVIESRFPAESKRLRLSAIRCFATVGGAPLDASEVVDRGWIRGFPWLRDALSATLAQSGRQGTHVP